MKLPSFKTQRLVAAIYVGVLLFAAGNFYLDWGVLGHAGKLVFSVLTLVLVAALSLFGPQLEREMKLRIEARSAAEAEAERVRDKSQDAEDTKRLREAIGLAQDNSPERQKHD